jgi:hypothetical protein
LSLALAVAGFALARCNQNPLQTEVSADSVREKAAAVAADPNPAREAKADGRSATAVTLGWHELAATTHATVFPVQVKNTTTETQTLDLLVSAFTPEGDPIDRALTSFNLPANSTRVVPIKADDFPAQSSGNAGGVRVVVRYVATGTAPSAPKFTVFTEPLMVTFDADFKAATARTVAAQVSETARAADPHAQLERKGEVRLKDAKNGAFTARIADSRGVQRGPTVILSQIPYPVDYKNATYAPETELAPRGDQ